MELVGGERDLHDGQVIALIHPGDASADRLAVAERDGDGTGSVHDMGISNDVAAGVDHESGPGGLREAEMSTDRGRVVSEPCVNILMCIDGCTAYNWTTRVQLYCG